MDFANWRHLFEAIFNSYFLTLFLLSFCVLGLLVNGNRRRFRIGLLVVLASCVLFSTGWLPRYLTQQLEGHYRAIDTVNPDIHWVVVLGGGHYQFIESHIPDQLTSASLRRLLEGVHLYRQLPKAKLVLSGGGELKGMTEAGLMNRLTEEFAIPKQAIVLETASINTADQARELKKIVQQMPFYLVTSAIHMPRSMALCQAQGLKPIAAPTDFTHYWYDERWQKLYLPNPNNWVYFNIVWHEILGQMWAKITRKIV